jgi:choline dehydrogenase
MGIPVVMDLPGVGQNLQDHLLTGVIYECKQPISLATAENLANLAKYLLLGKGMLTSNIAEAGGFIRLDGSQEVPDLQFHFAPVYYIEHGFQLPDGHGFSIGPTLIQPESKGYLQLKTADPLAYPLIQPNYFEDEADLEVMIEGLKVARKIANAPAFDAYRGDEIRPGPDVQSDEGLREYLRDTVETLYHPVGTCKMGLDSMAVVNPQLQVHGIQGLRVVDASIMPSIINANTNAPTIMIAEKAADMIRAA